MNRNFLNTLPQPPRRQPPVIVSRETVSSWDAFATEVSSVMQDIGDDDPQHQQDTFTPSSNARPVSQHPTASVSSSSSSSLSSSISTSLSPVENLLPRFERAMAQARRQVFFTPYTTPEVHEFDWKVVDFQPTLSTTTGQKRNWNAAMENLEDDDAEMEDSQASAGAATTVITSSSGSSASSSSSKPNQRRRFWKRSTSKQHSKIVDSSITPSKESSSSDNHSSSTNSSTNPFIRVGFSFRGFLGSSSAESSYTRPAKRTRVDSSYHLGPSADQHGILKNRTTSPDAVSVRTTTATPARSSSLLFAGSMMGDQQQGRFPTTVAATPSPSSQTRRRRITATSTTATKKRIRFVDSRMKVVKRLQAGNLFSFGNTPSAGYEELQDDSDGNDDHTLVLFPSNSAREASTIFHTLSPQQTAKTVRYLQVGNFRSGTMAEF